MKHKFKIKTHGRSEITYIENNRSTDVACEFYYPLQGGVGVVIYADHIKSWNEYNEFNSKNLISDQDKNGILNNIKDYFEKRKYVVEIESHNGQKNTLNL
jgi:hypothetical protein